MLEMITDKLKDYKWIAIAAFLITLIGIAFSLLQDNVTAEVPSFPEVQTLDIAVKDDTTTDRTNEDNIAPKTIIVDVKGAVQKEGIYELKEGQRINDLIHLAGGFLPEADPKSVNLAQKLSDEAVVYVAKHGENVSVITSPSATSASATSDKVKLNTATLSDLQTITGIGAKRAQDIIDYRDANGGFKSLEDLKNVSGIGDKTFDKIKEELSLD